MALINIDSDVFDICNRIKSIDDDYYLVLNTVKQRFEVHNKAQGRLSLAAVLPYDKLDGRTITYLLVTRREKAEKLIKEIEAENARIQKRAVDDSVDQAKCRLNDYLKYARNSADDIDFSEFN